MTQRSQVQILSRRLDKKSVFLMKDRLFIDFIGFSTYDHYFFEAFWEKNKEFLQSLEDAMTDIRIPEHAELRETIKK